MSAKASNRTTEQHSATSSRPTIRTPKQPTGYADQEEEYKYVEE